MAWDTDRRMRLPHDWDKRRSLVRQRANNQCEFIDEESKLRCPFFGTDCDHIVHGDDHSLSNLQWLCSGHHSTKSSREGNQAKRDRKARFTRKPEKHPGILD